MANISITHPEIAKQLHPTKNGNLKADQLTKGSHTKVWWLCEKTNCIENCKHEWVSNICNRINGNNCPFCSSQKICVHNSIVYTYPDIAKQWHPIKNGDLKPENVSYGSTKKIWWLCEITCDYGCKHEWNTSTSHRTKGNTKCPYCSDFTQKLCIHKSIVYTYPEIAKQWHPTKNGKLKPEDFTFGSHTKIWWLCEITCDYGCKHEWETTIHDRTSGRGCPHCINKCEIPCIHKSVVYTHPEIAKQWHPTKNICLKPEHYTFGSNIKVWWLCEKTCDYGCKHEWEAIINSRMDGSGCPHCSNKCDIPCIHNSVVYTHPELVKQWHPTKNIGLKPEHYTFGSNIKVWWLCEKTCDYGCKHEWEAIINSRRNGVGCPFCAKQNICIHESIVYTHPELVKQWHPTKNTGLKPDDFSIGSGHQKIWWLCEKTCDYGCKHEWETMVRNRTGGNGCPYCGDFTEKLCIHTSIVYTHPELVKQWHPTKNGNLKPEHFTFGSNIKVWWLCEITNNYECKHEWETMINSRRNGQGCPYCKNKTEKKLYDELIKHYSQLNCQFRVEWCKNINCLPYDFVLEEYRIIIELDGLQHLEDVKYFKSSFKEQHERDLYKMKCANEKGYSMIRLLQTDVFYNKYDWLSELKENIEKIKREKKIQIIYMCKNNEYDIFTTE